MNPNNARHTAPACFPNPQNDQSTRITPRPWGALCVLALLIAPAYAADTPAIEKPLVTQVAIKGATIKVTPDADGAAVTLAPSLTERGKTALGVPVFKTADGVYFLFNAKTATWSPLVGDALPGATTIRATPANLRVPFGIADKTARDKLMAGGQLLFAHGSGIGNIVANGTYGVVDAYTPTVRLLDASAPVAPGESATTPTPVKFTKAGKVLSVIGGKYQVTTAEGKAGEWTEQPGAVPAGAIVNMQITTSAEIGVNNAASLLTQEEGAESVKNVFQLTTEVVTFLEESELTQYLNGSFAKDGRAIDSPIKIDVPDITDVKLVNTKTGEVVPFAGIIPSQKELGISYKLSYTFNGVIKEVSFDVRPPLAVLTKELNIESGEKINKFQLSISGITWYCKTLSHVEYALGLNADTISSKDGVIVKLESYDPKTGAITINVDTSAATVTGKQIVQLKTVNDYASVTRTFEIALNPRKAQ